MSFSFVATRAHESSAGKSARQPVTRRAQRNDNGDSSATHSAIPGTDAVNRSESQNPTIADFTSAQDHELLSAFQQGNERGYVELYVRRQAEVYTFCLRLASGDRDLASDVFQDVWIKVYRKAHTFNTGEAGGALRGPEAGAHSGPNVLGWLYTISRTTFLNHKRQRSHTKLDDEHGELASTDRSLQPEFRSEQEMLRTRVEQAIGQLSLELREPFILREFDGFSYVEIAEQLAITHGAVRQRIYRAKQAMREMLADLVDDENLELESNSDHAPSLVHSMKFPK